MNLYDAMFEFINDDKMTQNGFETFIHIKDDPQIFREYLKAMVGKDLVDYDILEKASYNHKIMPDYDYFKDCVQYDLVPEMDEGELYMIYLNDIADNYLTKYEVIDKDSNGTYKDVKNTFVSSMLEVLRTYIPQKYSKKYIEGVDVNLVTNMCEGYIAKFKDDIYIKSFYDPDCETFYYTWDRKEGVECIDLMNDEDFGDRRYLTADTLAEILEEVLG